MNAWIICCAAVTCSTVITGRGPLVGAEGAGALLPDDAGTDGLPAGADVPVDCASAGAALPVAFG